MCHLDYNEILLQAIDTVLVSKLESLQYDKTVKCQVIANLGDGHYTVSENDTTKFEAVATSDAAYSIGDYVQVLVPSGDYATQKIIVSKYIASEDTKATVYLRPIDKFISLPQTVESNLETISEIITGGQGTSKKIGEIEILSNNKICDSLIIGGDIKADLTDRTGSYGLLFYLYYNGKVVAAQLDSSKMFGDPYKYKTFFSQLSAFDISAISGNVSKIEVYLYQKDFEVGNETIAVRNLWVQLGEDITNIPNETLTLIAENGENSYDATGSKELLLTWYNKNEDGRYIGYTQGKAYGDGCASELDYVDQLENKYLVDYEVDAATVAPMRETVALAHNQDEIASIYSKLDRNLRNLYVYVLQRGDAMGGDFEALLALCDPIATENTFNIAIAEQAEENLTSYTKFNAQALLDYQNVERTDNALEYLSVLDIAVNGFSLEALWARSKDAILAARSETSEAAYFDLLLNNYNKYYNEFIAFIARLQELYGDSSACVEAFYARIDVRDTQTLEEARSAFIAAQSNKYDLYWYRASAGSEDQWLGLGWKLIGRDPSFATGTITERISYLLATDPTAEEMEIKALLFYQHEQFASNSIKLTNLEPPAATPPDIASALRIDHGENSQDSYQKYGSNYVVLATSDYITKRTLTLSCEGLEDPTSVLGRVVYWYVPDHGTMLRAENSELLAQGFTYLDPQLQDTELGDEDLGAILRHKKEGYYCYYKVIADLVDDLEFYYHIAQVYNPSYNNNTIVCVLDQEGIDYSTRKTFTFSTFGTMGTQYTLALVPKEQQQAVIVGSNSPLVFNSSLTGYGGTELDTSPQIKYTIENGNDLIGTDSDSDYQILFKDSITSLDKYTSTACFLTATAIIPRSDTDSAEVELISKIPIPFATGNYYLQGTTAIVYNNYGTLLTTNNIEPYVLYDLDTGIAVKNVSYSISPVSGIGQPTLQTINEKTTLEPCQMFIDGLTTPVITVKKNGKVIFVQPIYIYQDNWASSLLNAWDEKLTINENSGIILSTMMGAGYKNQYNQFYGVLMGKLEDTVGLYGFSAGSVAYSFDINGKAVLGKSGSGQIVIDGNNATIASGNYSLGNQGMQIDLENGHIDAYDFKLTSGHVIIDSNGSTTGYLKVLDSSNNNLVFISGDEYYLQGSDKDSLRIDLKNNTLKAKNFTLDAWNEDKGLLLTDKQFKLVQDKDNQLAFNEEGKLTIRANSLYVSGSNSFEIDSDNEKFTIGGLSYSDGNLNITDGTISGGSINVNDGSIGGWQIQENSIVAEGWGLYSSNGDVFASLVSNNGNSPIVLSAGLSESSSSLSGTKTWTITNPIASETYTCVAPHAGKITAYRGPTFAMNYGGSSPSSSDYSITLSGGILKFQWLSASMSGLQVKITYDYTYTQITKNEGITKILQDGSFYTSAARIGNWLLKSQDLDTEWRGSLLYVEGNELYSQGDTYLSKNKISTTYLDGQRLTITEGIYYGSSDSPFLTLGGDNAFKSYIYFEGKTDFNRSAIFEYGIRIQNHNEQGGHLIDITNRQIEIGTLKITESGVQIGNSEETYLSWGTLISKIQSL